MRGVGRKPPRAGWLPTCACGPTTVTWHQVLVASRRWDWPVEPCKLPFRTAAIDFPEPVIRTGCGVTQSLPPRSEWRAGRWEPCLRSVYWTAASADRAGTRTRADGQGRGKEKARVMALPSHMACPQLGKFGLYGCRNLSHTYKAIETW